MKGLCGWFSLGERATGAGQEPAEILQRMLAGGQAESQARESSLQAGAALAVFGDVARPRLVQLDDFVLALGGHPRLIGSGSRSADPMLIARALRERGRHALPAIGGDFVLAAWNGRSRSGLLAIDRVGVHRLVHVRVGDSLVFASTLDLLGGHPGVRRELSAQGLFNYLHFHVSPGPQTVFKGLDRLEPGHCIEFAAGAVSMPRRYWSMEFSEERDTNPEDLRDRFVRVVRGAVGEAAEGASCGTFLSGGTDSSTISGMLTQVASQPTQTFSIGFDAKGYDEMEYARIAARHFGCEHHEYYVTPRDVVDALPRIAAAYDEPFGNASAIPTYYCARMAREHGMTRMLAGDGGDELFGGNERYATQNLLAVYQRVPGLLRRTLVEPILLCAPGIGRVPPLRKLRSYVEQARPPMPRRYESYNLLMHLGVDNIFEPDFLEGIDAQRPQHLMDEAHRPYAGESLINQMLGIDLRFTLADADLPKVHHMCELAGIDVGFPLLDDRVIDFSRGLPADHKLKGLKLRWFFKDALKDFLPPAVITKKKHGFGLPVGTWLTGHKPLLDLATDSIRSLQPQGIVRPAFVDELLGRKLKEHPTYFGTMVWVLAMLGMWLQSRRL